MASVSTGNVEALVANTRSGTVRACNRSRLSLAMGGQVSKLHVDQGDKVAGGALLLELWNEDLRSEEHTSELQSREKLVCRLLLGKQRYTTRPPPPRRSCA